MPVGADLERRLAAILAADVVGYSFLVERDEAWTLATLRDRRKSILSPLVALHKGRIVKLMGDGVLVEFASAVNAVKCAVALQEKMAEANIGLEEDRAIVLRMGINLGDVAVEGEDLYGEGVNIAARLEGIAEPGTICISGAVYDQVNGKVKLDYKDLGHQPLKNITEPVKAYVIRSDDPRSETKLGRGALPLPAKPSIAVLPFVNLSADREQDFFADGLTEDLAIDLARNSGFFVIASHSSRRYKNSDLSIGEIARTLGVRFILKGTVRRFEGRVRVTVQLVDVVKGGQVWADRLDRELADIFSLQDEITARIVGAIVGAVPSIGGQRRRPVSLAAYELVVRGRACLNQSPEGTRRARALFEDSFKLDPGFGKAQTSLAMAYWFAWAHWGEAPQLNRSLALSAAHRAIELDPADPDAHWVTAWLQLYERQWDTAAAEFETALRLNPSHADTWAGLSELMVFAGQPTRAMDCISHALRLNPHPPGWYYFQLGFAQYEDGQYLQAVETLRREETYTTPSRRILAASLAQLGRMEEARKEAAEFMATNPTFRIGQWRHSQPFRDVAAGDRFVAGFRKAGLPE